MPSSLNVPQTSTPVIWARESNPMFFRERFMLKSPGGNATTIIEPIHNRG